MSSLKSHSLWVTAFNDCLDRLITDNEYKVWTGLNKPPQNCFSVNCRHYIVMKLKLLKTCDRVEIITVFSFVYQTFNIGYTS